MSWTRGPIIGRGATAAVSLATTPAGYLFAVKSAGLASSALLRKEECFISQLSSPYIIRCLGSDVTHGGDTSLYNLFLEYCSGGSLSDLIRKQGGSIDEKWIRFYAYQLLLGIEYLHRNGLVHCDIKAQNILIPAHGLKIADFGCAKWAGNGCFEEGAFSGTPAYMAPEVARGEEQSFPADVWALGCTVIEMATGTHPWPEMKNPASALYRIAFSGDIPDFPSWFSGEAKDFLGKCLMRDSKTRWTAAELLRHPFFISVECCEENRRSPNSVTDQRFWDSVEVSESFENAGNEMEWDSPRRRMEALICRWELEEEEEEDEWVSVRSNEGQECEDANPVMEDSCSNFCSNIQTFVVFRITSFEDNFVNGIIPSSTVYFVLRFILFTSIRISFVTIEVLLYHVDNIYLKIII